MYKLDSPFVKQNYPIIYKVWTEHELGKGYAQFRQMGLKLKEKQLHHKR